MLATKTRPVDGSGKRVKRLRHPGLRLSTGALVAGGMSVTFIVARDGTLVWQLGRGAATAGLAAVTLRGLRRARPVGQTLIEIGAGLVLLSVGIGIGPAHIAKAGPLAMTAAGVTSLLAGLTVLLAGAVGAWRVGPGWRRVPVVISIVAVTATATLTLGQAIAATNAPPTAVGKTTPADRGLRYRDVAFPASDGVQLSGWYVPSRNRAAVVLLHGAGSTRSGVLDHAVALARSGYGVLLFDARGHGRSTGRAMDFGWDGDADISGAVSFLRARPDVDDERIAAVGMSMGGEEAIGAAATDDRIRAVVAEGATNRVAGDKAWLSEQYGWRGAVQEGLERFLYGVTDLLTSAHPPLTLHAAVAEAAPRPVLLIAGGDRPDEGFAGRFIAKGSPDTVQLWVVPDAGHTAGLSTHPDAWQRRVTAFLDNALHVTRPPAT